MPLPQLFERTKDLSGEIKAAREMVNITAAELEAKEHAATLARQAYDKATVALQSKLDERDSLADRMAAEVRNVGDSQEALEPAEPSPFWNPDHQANALQNGAAHVERAFNEATS